MRSLPPGPLRIPPFRYRALTPAQDRAIAEASRKGALARDLARAYSVSVRAIYRALQRATRPTYTVELAGYRADFQLEDGIPVQVTGWVPA